ncbi:MAG: hypothetical protein KBE65_13195 [Phycisphaerae bacterium]|nr:hypothetical protein [Phycisphaerae bacterium]
MKRVLFLVVAGACLAAPATADMVQFYQLPYDNVDSTTGFGAGTNVLAVSQLSLLAGDAMAYAMRNGSAGVFTQRDTRGLGIQGGELDEVDKDLVGIVEHIDVVFTEAYYIDSVELRSLFKPDPSPAAGEIAVVSVIREYGTSSQVTETSWQLLGFEDIAWGTDGAVTQSLGGIVLNAGDALVFSPEAGEFALAAMTVRLVPVPGAVLLGLLGLGYAGMRLRRSA